MNLNMSDKWGGDAGGGVVDAKLMMAAGKALLKTCVALQPIIAHIELVKFRFVANHFQSLVCAVTFYGQGNHKREAKVSIGVVKGVLVMSAEEIVETVLSQTRQCFLNESRECAATQRSLDEAASRLLLRHP